MLYLWCSELIEPLYHFIASYQTMHTINIDYYLTHSCDRERERDGKRVRVVKYSTTLIYNSIADWNYMYIILLSLSLSLTLIIIPFSMYCWKVASASLATVMSASIPWLATNSITRSESSYKEHIQYTRKYMYSTWMKQYMYSINITYYYNSILNV